MSGSSTVISTPHKVHNKGFKFTGDRNGYHATVPYLVEWQYAFLFMDEVLSSANATVAGPFQVLLPKRFPTGAIMVAETCDISPCGADGQPLAANEGLRPGEYFTHAIITVQYNTPNFTWSAADDQNGLQQLDPANPIVRCEQAVKFTGKAETRQGSKYKYDTGLKIVPGQFTQLIVETNLTLSFPKVPFLPWSQLKPYIGRVNSASVLGCAAETLLLLGANTAAKFMTGAGSTSIAQHIVLEFAVNEDNWNKLPKPDGSLDYVHKLFGTAGVDTLYQKVDFTALFNYLSSYEG